jgi:septal ring factor EnvC (AmiA/AmiB activator)
LTQSETFLRPAALRPALVAMAAALPLGIITASAQTTSPAPGGRPESNRTIEAPLPLTPPARLDALKQRDKQLEAVRAQQKRAVENEAKLKREIEQISSDRRKFNEQLISTVARVTSLEERNLKTQERLSQLDDSERGLRRSLEERRSLIVEVLAALQRLGRRAPPAILLRAEDALQAVRSAMMLGAVLPEIRSQVEVLASDLAELVRLRRQIAEERDRLARDLLVLADDRQRLSLLVEERQKKQAEAEKALAEERQRAVELARQANDLQELIARLEQDLTAPFRPRSPRPDDDKKPPDGRPDLAALKDPGRLAPAVPFASARGMLPLPANGVKIREFGAADGLGGTEKGLSLATRSGAQITAPCDGWVVYAGTFRNYGQLLILNAGGGYHVLLAGMERISVDLGQFVVTGEPVAIMGGGVQSAATIATGASRPVLYVEFRKDGTPVDPGPWWAASEGEKVRG